MNRITELLDLEDSVIVVSDIRVEDRRKLSPLRLHLLSTIARSADSACIPAVLKTMDFASHPAGQIRTVPAVKTAALAMHKSQLLL